MEETTSSDSDLCPEDIVDQVVEETVMDVLSEVCGKVLVEAAVELASTFLENRGLLTDSVRELGLDEGVDKGEQEDTSSDESGPLAKRVREVWGPLPHFDRGAGSSKGPVPSSSSSDSSPPKKRNRRKRVPRKKTLGMKKRWSSAQEEINFLQNTDHPVTDRAPFARAARRILKRDHDPSYHFSNEAIDLLQARFEKRMVRIFGVSYDRALQDGRDTVEQADMWDSLDLLWEECPSDSDDKYLPYKPEENHEYPPGTSSSESHSTDQEWHLELSEDEPEDPDDAPPPPSSRHDQGG